MRCLPTITGGIWDCFVSDKRKKKKFAEKREQRRLKRLADEGRLVNGKEVPLGAVLADQSQQVPNRSYSPPPTYYVDVEFTCCDCGRDEVWTARQQKWYYEVAKGSLFATAIRCRGCRNKLNDLKDLQRQQMVEAERRQNNP
ncbi:MAG: zinc-ribbon domain containing protein [Planctomycetaceae bacterium]|nr:zinc-ribbon domain containing protein [Planctomycetaceae bacterium]